MSNKNLNGVSKKKILGYLEKTKESTRNTILTGNKSEIAKALLKRRAIINKYLRRGAEPKSVSTEESEDIVEVAQGIFG